MNNTKDITDALTLFEDAAIKHGKATEQGDYKTCNECYFIIERSITFLRQQDEVLALEKFLNHHSASVLTWAATYLLPIKEKEAILVLEELVKRTDIYSLDAETTLSEWRNGNLKP